MTDHGSASGLFQWVAGGLAAVLAWVARALHVDVKTKVGRGEFERFAEENTRSHERIEASISGVESRVREDISGLRHDLTSMIRDWIGHACKPARRGDAKGPDDAPP